MFASLLLSLACALPVCSLDSLPRMDSVYTMKCETENGDTLYLYRLGPSLSDSMGYDLSLMDDATPLTHQGVVVDGHLVERVVFEDEIHLSHVWDVCTDQDGRLNESRGSDDLDCDNLTDDERAFIAAKWGN